MENVNLNHLDAGVHYDMAAYGYDYRLDGNNVDVDTENVELASEQLRYQLLADSVTQEFTRLSTAIGS
jgi:flagellar basal-body rod protein FlgB